jgi:hypothetical protein
MAGRFLLRVAVCVLLCQHASHADYATDEPVTYGVDVVSLPIGVLDASMLYFR